MNRKQESKFQAQRIISQILENQSLIMREYYWSLEGKSYNTIINYLRYVKDFIFFVSFFIIVFGL